MAFEELVGNACDEAGAAGLGGMQVLGREPHVFKNVNEIDDDVDVHAAGVGFGLDPVESVVVSVDKDDPAASALGVTLLESSIDALSSRLTAFGPGLRELRSAAVAGRMSAGSRTTGGQS